MIRSLAICTGNVEIPYVEGEYSMFPFDLQSLAGLPEQWAELVKGMLLGISNLKGTAFFYYTRKRIEER